MDFASDIEDFEVGNFSEEDSHGKTCESDAGSVDSRAPRRRAQPARRGQRQRGRSGRRARADIPRRRDARGRRAAVNNRDGGETDGDDDGNEIASVASIAAASASPPPPLQPPPPPPPPPPQEVWDMLDEELYARSDFIRLIREQRMFGSLLAQEPIRPPLRRDPLGNCRLDHEQFPRDDATIDAFIRSPVDVAWNRLLRQFGVLRQLKEIPLHDYGAQLDLYDDLALLVDTANLYPHAPTNPRHVKILTDQLTYLGNLVWMFYLKIRTPMLKKNVVWWMISLGLHKLAIEKLPDIHGLLAQVYNTCTLGEYLDKFSRNDVTGDRTTDCWIYMRHACRNGFTGRALDIRFITPLAASTTTHSLPHPKVLKPGETQAPRAVVEKIHIHMLFRSTLYVLRYKFSEMPLDAFIHVYTELCNNSLFINRTPAVDFLHMILWYHLCRLAINGEELRHLLNSHTNQKRKPVPLAQPGVPGTPQFYKPLSGRFLRDAENMFVNQLEILRTYYTLVEQAVRMAPPPARQSQSHQQQQQQQQQASVLSSSTPVGFFDTLLFPECRQFLPSLAILEEAHSALIKIYLGKASQTEPVETNAVLKIYYQLLVASVIVPGSFDAVLRKAGALAPKASFILDYSKRMLIPPVAQLTFKHLPVAIVLGFMGGGLNLFSKLTTDPMHALVAPMAYSCMMAAVLQIATFSTKSIGPKGGITTAATERPNSFSITTMNRDDLEALAVRHIARFPSVSATGDNDLLRQVTQTITASSNNGVTRPGGANNQGDAQAPHILPIEEIHSSTQWLILCDDSHGHLSCCMEERVRWTKHRQNWPRWLRTSGEHWICTPEGDFFLRTQDPMEALYAWFLRVVYTLGTRVEVTTGFIAIFERHIGRILREQVFVNNKPKPHHWLKEEDEKQFS